MSKWILPDQEGAELWPQSTRQPLVVRVAGARSTSEADAIAERYAIYINHFYITQTTARARSGLGAVQTRYSPFADLRMTYTYNNGLEYVDVEVAGVGSPSGGIEDFWDYALVELVMGNAYYSQGGVALYCYAHMTAPVEDVLTDASVWPAKGVASNSQTQPTIDPIINGANSAATIADVTVNDQVGAASFMVDLRPSRGAASTVDLYAYLYCRDRQPPSSAVGWYSNGVIVESYTQNPAVADVEPTWPTDWSSYGSPPPAATIPPSHYDWTLHEWLWSTNTPQMTQDNGYAYDGWAMPNTPINPTSFDTWVAGQATNAYMYPPSHAPHSWQRTHNWWRWWIKTTGTEVLGYTGPAQVPATVNITYFKGAPQLVSTHYHNGYDYFRWGPAAGATQSPMIFMPVAVPAYSNSTFPSNQAGRLDNFYTTPKLGLAMLDTHRIVRERPGIIVDGSWKSV